ncbi:DUF4123 domain-containing protein [Shewanella indica]|uniref:DUF4123 domain-containing protein n=1 Tax=Shewanella indica TaxID=768528 RepID=UPI001F3E5779|nr:DUF4123 domain-containing protein [Shewanella indica]MCE9793812.1 DUF4123 domain-containing protein [Shewanella indica]
MSELLPELAGVEYWMLTDKIRYPKVMQLAYQHEAAPELADLFINSPFAYLMPQSPVIFRLRHDSSLLTIWQNDSLWRSSAVIFACQAGAFDTLKQHLLALLQPRILGRQTIFRYYSNQTLDPLYSELDADDRDTLLGPASALWWASQQGEIRSLKHTPKAVESYSFNSAVFSKWI